MPPCFGSKSLVHSLRFFAMPASSLSQAYPVVPAQFFEIVKYISLLVPASTHIHTPSTTITTILEYRDTSENPNLFQHAQAGSHSALRDA